MLTKNCWEINYISPADIQAFKKMLQKRKKPQFFIANRNTLLQLQDN